MYQNYRAMDLGSDFDRKGSLDRDFATEDLEQNGI